MSKFESQIKQIAYTADKVYAKLSDLNNLAAIKNKLNDPDAQEKLKEKIPADNNNCDCRNTKNNSQLH